MRLVPHDYYTNEISGRVFQFQFHIVAPFMDQILRTGRLCSPQGIGPPRKLYLLRK